MMHSVNVTLDEIELADLAVMHEYKSRDAELSVHLAGFKGSTRGGEERT